MGIWDSVNKQIKAGSTLTSSATSTRRTGVQITYQASVASSQATAANTAAHATASTLATQLSANVGTANTQLSATVPVPSAAAITASPATNQGPDSPSAGGMGGGAIAGIVIGVLAAVIGAGAVYYFSVTKAIAPLAETDAATAKSPDAETPQAV